MSARKVRECGLLLFGEGFDEQVVAKYIKSVYAPGMPAKIEHSNGGCAQKTVLDLRKHDAYPAANTKVVVVDSDKPESNQEIQAMKDLIGDEAIIPIISEWNLEYELLRILSCTGICKKPSKCQPHTLKAELKELIGDIDADNLKKFFPKSVLDAHRSSSQWMDNIIRLFEGWNQQ